jgi:hypothetical protein
MIPAHTAYGFDVVRALGTAGPRLTTGHAATAASVVRTTMRALDESGAQLSERSVAVIGLGSIGWSALQLLLDLGAGLPKRVLLCDVAARAKHLGELAAVLRARGCPVKVGCEPDDPAAGGLAAGGLPAAAYEADLILGATSADVPVLDIDRLRPGTIVVDDSFPHCFDPRSAGRRMAERGDVLVVGGGLLSAGTTQRTIVEDPLLRPYQGHLTGLRLPGTVASCQLEALLQVNRPDLPPVLGVVDPALALSYWQALADLGVEAAPLHLQRLLVSVKDGRTRVHGSAG